MNTQELAAARHFEFPRSLAEKCVQEMRNAAEEGDERFLALTATIENGLVVFRRAVVPEQTCHHTEQGLLVTINGEAIFDLNRSCYQREEILAGQIHAHPGRAYHSGADDNLALVRLQGGLSIVVPNFARGALQPRRWAIYQLRKGVWKRRRPWRLKVVVN